MNNIFRNMLAVALGVVLGGAANMALIVLGPHVIPAPAGVDVTSAESIAASQQLFEAKHFLFPFLAHAFGTFVGALIAFLVAGIHRVYIAYLVGVFFLAGGITASFMIPAPTWFIALDLVVAYIPMAWLAIRSGQALVK